MLNNAYAFTLIYKDGVEPLREVRDRANIPEFVTDVSIAENMESGMQMGLAFELEGKKSCIPLGDTGFISALQRAGYQSATCLSTTDSKREFVPMQAENRAMVVNFGLETQKNKEMQILVRDEKIRYVGSNEYQILLVFE